jgi:outer membrane protein insertion porin family
MRLSHTTLFAAFLAIAFASGLSAQHTPSEEGLAEPAGRFEDRVQADPLPSPVPPVYLLAQAQQPAQQPASPFEDIPLETPEPASPFDDVTEEQARQRRPGEDIVEDVTFRGTRRIPRDSLAARIFTKRGDLFDAQTLRRDFMVLWNTGYFDDLRLEIEDGELGKIVRFLVTERRVVRTIRYEGNKSATLSDILERFKERSVGLTVESRYDPTTVNRAAFVLRELLGERGRQYADITPEVRQIPPASVEIVFNIDEGPKVKVGDVSFDGLEVISRKSARRAMKNTKPIGIPRSFVLENLFTRTFDVRKLEEDKERLRNAYQKRGYFKANVLRHELDIRDSPGRATFLIPWSMLFNKPKKHADINLLVEEGPRYARGKLSFTDVELFRVPDQVLGPVFAMQEGAMFDIEKLRKGMENLKKLYGEFGYIDFVAEPSFEFREDESPPLIDLNLAVDEGKQFFVRRIEFDGNNTTRDKVIRREILLDEGDMFNTRMWDVSMLRLNQLGYFDPIKTEGPETDTVITRNTRDGLVDLTLKVKERGRNMINLNGGVSGFAGSFIGFGYATNNFLGLGETLSFDAQLGSRERVLQFGYTEPYLFDKPIQAGFTIFSSRFSFNQAREASIFAGANLIPLFNQLGQENILDYRQTSAGFTTFLSYPLRRSFARLSLTYSYRRSNVVTFSRSAANLFTYLNFEGVSGPNSLEGITTSQITPGYFYNTVDHPITPSKGKSLYVSMAIAGFGGNARFVQPTVEAKYFRPHGGRRTIAMRGLFSFLSGYGGRVPPPFNRSFMGGENDVRGFQIWSISPMVWIPDFTAVPVYNDNLTSRTQVQIVNGVEERVPITTEVPVYRLNFPGGDTRFVYNFEYRIKLFGPVVLAPFWDIGFNKILRKNQIRLNPGRALELNKKFPQAGFREQIGIIGPTQKMRASTGVELQVMMPVVNAPFRFYWAYNPMRVQEFLRPPIVADRSLFPNYNSFIEAVRPVGTWLPFFEKRSMFRFTISRTF